jgi:2-polyprenyl-6-methoxyphenol hydroxylase-like FAD-dependent oxidoreductase
VDGVKRSIDAKYVVGADGMHSAVRKAAEIDFEGGAFEHSFVLADVEMAWDGGRKEVMLCFTPAGPLVIAPLPSERRYRIVAAMENAPEKPGVADIEGILARHGPKGAAGSVTSLVWSSRFRIHHRLAERYRKGRMIIMGDAAHVHSPAGGQGMNTGLVDAVVLGRLLTQAVKQGRDGALDAYERKRRPAAQKVLGLSSQLTNMAMTKGAFARWLRNRRLKTIGHLPPLRRKLELNLSGLARRDDARV